MIETIGHGGFPRVRMGIGRSTKGQRVDEFVLSPFEPEERDWLDEFIGRGVGAVETLLSDGIQQAMNRFN